MRIVDEIAQASGWMAEERMARTSHALEVDGRVWLFDVVDWPGLDERVRELGEPPGSSSCSTGTTATAPPSRGGSACRTTSSARAPRDAVRAAPGRPAPLVARGGALVARAAAPAGRGCDRDDPLLPRGRRAGRPPPRAPAPAAARAPRPRARPPARRARRGDPSPARGARERAQDGPPADPALAGRAAASRSRGVLGAEDLQRARASSPGRTSRGGAFRPASRTGGLSGSASGAAANDAARRSAGASP